MNPAELFSHETNLVELAPGEVLFREGDPGDTMFVLLEGSLDVLVGNTTVGGSIRGDMLGEMALIDQSPRSATVVAREPARLARLDSQRFQRLIQQHPFFALHLMKVLADRIRHKDHLLAQNKSA
jgi:CRP/FNR family cyclic AMP-dependent transcriptional regulator